eukprot:GGOE01005332.1.p1 GENE.GGOE01005332.1~~GGOE01005332.1.p1  ORF type:complete len:494 (-),score=95.96 GGOE01005332.1:295-1752(-)
MYAKPQALPEEDVLKAATDGAIVVWVYWGFETGCQCRDSDPFVCYPRPVCEELTKGLRAKSDKVTSHENLPVSDEYPADNGSRKVGFRLFPQKGKYLQYNLVEKFRTRRCFPCPVRWQWNQSANPCEVQWGPYPEDIAWELERAYAEHRTTHQFTHPLGVKRVVDLAGCPMVQAPPDEPHLERQVRREGPDLYFSHHLKWVKGAEGALPPRVELSQADVDRFVTLMDRATQWHSFPDLQHRNLGCVPGPGSVRTQKLRVVNVERVQAPLLWEAYAARREELRTLNCGPLFPRATSNPQAWCPRLQTAEHFDAAAFYSTLDDPMAQLDSSVNEVLLFHGTCTEVIDKVTRQDSMSSSKFTTLGPAIYFADLASKSNLYVPCPDCGGGSYQCRRECTCSSPPTYKMLLCRVLLGRIRQEDQIRGQNSSYYQSDDNVQSMLKEYDSVFVPMEKELGNNNTSFLFREWAVYTSNHVYPEFVIWYTRHDS